MDKQKIQDIVANNIRNLMNKHSVTNPELARRCRISSGMVSKIVNGSTGITITMALNLAGGLGVDISEILKGLTKKQVSAVEESTPAELLSIGILSINNKRICCIKDHTRKVIGTAELERGLDLAETSSHLLHLIQEVISEALPSDKAELSTLKNANLKLVMQSYEFEDTRHKFINFMKRYFSDVLLISDWQLTYLTDFKDEHGISLVVDKGVSLSYRKNGKLKKLGGWKFPVYDLGGENWLGVETIKHTIEAAEGYIPMTKLAHTVLGKFNGKIERITEMCFKNSNPDIYCLFGDILLRCYYTGDKAAINIIKSGFEKINRTLAVADEKIGKKVKIALNGSLAEIYQPFLDKSRLVKAYSDADKVKLLADITEDFLIAHGVEI